MKTNIFLTVVAVAAMTSCSQNEVLDTMSTQSEINFRTTIGKQTTRAAEATKSTLETDGNGFKIVGYATGDVFASIAADEVGTAFINSALKYTSGIWGAATPLYWPTTKSNLSVFAIYPTRIGAANLDIAAPIAAPMTYPTLNVEIPTEIGQQVDLLLANTMDQSDKSKALAIQFKHVLSQVRFAARTTDGSYKVKIKEIKLLSAVSNSTFTFDGQSTVGAWSTTVTPSRVDYGYYTGMYPTDATFIGSSYDQIPSTGIKGALMLVPQAKAVAFKLSVTYMISNPAGITLANDVTKEVAMEKLEMGKKYLYNLTLPIDKGTVTPITFTVDVANWESDTNIDVSYFVHKLSADGAADGIALANNIKSFCTNRTGVIAKHTVEVSGKMAADITIDLGAANTASLENDDEIILDFSKVDFTTVSGRKITVNITGNNDIMANGGIANVDVTAAGKVVLKKKVIIP